MVPLMSDCIPPPLLGRSAGLLLFANGFGPAVGYAVIGEFKSQNIYNGRQKDARFPCHT